MTSDRRRAAGTQTFTDVLKIWSGLKQPSVAADINDFAAGTTLEVSCFLRPLEEPKARSQLGVLRLTRGEPVTWLRRGKDAITFQPPLTVEDSTEKAKGPKFGAFTLITASGSFSAQIPLLDAELVGHALGEYA